MCNARVADNVVVAVTSGRFGLSRQLRIRRRPLSNLALIVDEYLFRLISADKNTASAKQNVIKAECAR